MIEEPVQIHFVLISHTNNGKTTLARTLLGADVGEVRDAAHVTLYSESHQLLTTAAGDSLHLWDTPGFGDSVRLLKRLRISGNPIGWFLREVLDRHRDRTFWLSQLALRAAKDAADVVLYLVNSSEHPKDAGYLAAEMQILAWLGKPVMVLMNQTGSPRPLAAAQADQALWANHLAQYPCVRDVLPLDAFTRCWVHERVFFEAIAELIDTPKKAGYARLLAAWDARNTKRFIEAMRLTSQLIMTTAQSVQWIDAERNTRLKSALKIIGLGKSSHEKRQQAAMNTLIARLNDSIGTTTAELVALHQLEPGTAVRINAHVKEHFVVRAPLDPVQASLLGAISSGAATGLAADLMAGGLTAGVGALLGGVVGALTFAGAAWGFNLTTDRDPPSVRFTDDFLRTVLITSILRYLTVAHFGRGRGNFVEDTAPSFWQSEVERAVAAHEKDLIPLWQALRTSTEADAAGTQLQIVITDITSRTLAHLYPGFVNSAGTPSIHAG